MTSRSNASRLSNILGVVALTALSLVVGGSLAQADTPFAPVTVLEKGKIYIDLDGITGDGKGAFLDAPDTLHSIKLRRGTYQFRWDARATSVSEIQSASASVCDAQQRRLAGFDPAMGGSARNQKGAFACQ